MMSCLLICQYVHLVCSISLHDWLTIVSGACANYISVSLYVVGCVSLINFPISYSITKLLYIFHICYNFLIQNCRMKCPAIFPILKYRMGYAIDLINDVLSINMSILPSEFRCMIDWLLYMESGLIKWVFDYLFS